MNKKLILFISVFLVLSSFVFGETALNFGISGGASSQACGVISSVNNIACQSISIGNVSTSRVRIGLGATVGTPVNMKVCITAKYQDVSNPIACSPVIPSANLNQSYLTMNYFDLNKVNLNTSTSTYYICTICDASTTNNYFRVYTDNNVYGSGILYYGTNTTWSSNSAQDITGSFYYNDYLPPYITPSLTLYSDLQNNNLKFNTTNINFYFNGTSINNSITYNCSLYFNDIYNNNIENVNISQINNISLINLLGYYENTYKINLSCSNENATTTHTNYINIDNKKPTLNYIGFKDTYSNTENVYINFSISDNNLTFFNIETKRAGLTFDNITHDNIKINTYEVYNTSSTSFNIGSFDYSLLVYDGYQYVEFTGNYNITSESGLSAQALIDINNNITDFKNKFIEVFGMLGFILINMLYLVIVYYFIMPVSDKFKFVTIIPAINIILISFYSLGLNIFSEYLFNTYILISSVLFFVVLLLSYVIGMFTTKDDKPKKKNFYSEFD